MFFFFLVFSVVVMGGLAQSTQGGAAVSSQHIWLSSLSMRSPSCRASSKKKSASSIPFLSSVFKSKKVVYLLYCVACGFI